MKPLLMITNVIQREKNRNIQPKYLYKTTGIARVIVASYTHDARRGRRDITKKRQESRQKNVQCVSQNRESGGLISVRRVAQTRVFFAWTFPVFLTQIEALSMSGIKNHLLTSQYRDEALKDVSVTSTNSPRTVIWTSRVSLAQWTLKNSGVTFVSQLDDFDKQTTETLLSRLGK